MQKLIIIVLLSLSILGCKKDGSNPIITPETLVEKGKTTVLIEKGLIQDQSPDWTIVTMLGAKASATNPDTSIYFAMSETSPQDTFVILSKGSINKKIDTSGIPIADYFWGIKAYFQKNDTGRVKTDIYFDLVSYSLIDSIILEPYKLISNGDTIKITDKYMLYWKPDYRIDTLRFKVYVQPNLYLNYDRFSTSSMNLVYKTAAYDTSQRVASFVVGIPTMTTEPNIILQPFSKIDLVYENSYIKVISRFDYQQQKKIAPWLLH